jgi:localization factor PodJL
VQPPGGREATGAERAPPGDDERAPIASRPARWRGVLPILVALLFAAGYGGVAALLAPGSVARAMSPAPAAPRPAHLPVPWAAAEHPQGSAATAVQPQGSVPERAPASAEGAVSGALAGGLGPLAGAGGPLARATPADAGQATDGPDLPVAIGSAALRQAALSGDAVALFEVATRFAEGRGIAKDQAQAMAWLQRAALRGFGPAQFQLGMRFERGGGVAIDLEQAKLWYRRAAEQGVVRAMHNLAVLTIGRDKRAADYALAAPWFQAAAVRGLPDSQFNLAVLYENGLGIARDPAVAYFWYTLAAEGGDKEAAHRLEQIAPLLTPDQLIGAQRRASVWRAIAQ